MSLIVLAIWIGRDALVRQYLVNRAEHKIGAKVEIGHVYTSLSDSKIFIKQLSIADPREPMQNLFQSAAAVLELDWDRLLQREFVVKHGSISELVFGTPRTNSGKLLRTSSTHPANNEKSEINFQLGQQSPDEAWLDHFNVSNGSINAESLKLTQTANQVFDKLNTDLNLQLQQLNQLKSTIVEIRKAVSAFDSNVLRADKLKEAEKRLEAANQEIEQTVRRMTALDLQLATDKVALQEAKESDERKLSGNPDSRFVDAEILNRILLNEDQITQAKQVLDWYLSFRDTLPNPTEDFRPQKEKGTYVPLPLQESLPDVWIQSLDLDGEGRIAGSKFNFSGTATNLSTDPERLNEPAKIQLRAQGQAHVVVDCTIDRTNPSDPRDVIHMVCSDIPVPAKTLGKKQMMQMVVSPCRSKIDITLTCNGNELEGDLNFEFENLVPQIEHLDALAGGLPVAKRVNLELGNISNYTVKAKIYGTLQEPVVDFQSDLGEKLAQTVNSVLGYRQKTTQQQLDKLLKEHFARLETFSGRIHAANKVLENEIIQEQTRIASELRNRTNGFSTSRALRR